VGCGAGGGEDGLGAEAGGLSAGAAEGIGSRERGAELAPETLGADDVVAFQDAELVREGVAEFAG
jgi:hypothetical protein